MTQRSSTVLFSARIPREMHRRLALVLKRRPYLASLRAALVLALTAGLDVLDAEDREGRR
jgi:hypothetical protein